MNGRYSRATAYDIEQFAVSLAGAQQGVPFLASNGGPCFEGYNPSRRDPYNSTTTTTTTTSTAASLAAAPHLAAHHHHHHHALLQPASQSTTSPPPLPLIPADLEPIPLSKSTVHRHNQQMQVAMGGSGLSPLQMSCNDPLAGLEDKLLGLGESRYAALFSDPLEDLALSSGFGGAAADHAFSSRPTHATSSSSSSSVGLPTNSYFAQQDDWLNDVQLEISGLSLTPLSGAEIMRRLRDKTDHVVTRYLPCVDFLVACQQELRAGLAAATQKKYSRHVYRDSMTPRQFYNRYIGPLADRFFRKNVHIMESSLLASAVQEIQKLCQDALSVEHQGCEVMKNTFLGGMKDGESWGLRKWLSKNGCALHICNDLECIVNALQKLNRTEESTRKLAELVRPLAKQALDRLKADVPSSYQEVSSAHPYLPFFHRLESALKGMSGFDPDDDDVICIDDEDEIEEVKAKSGQSSKKRADSPILNDDEDVDEEENQKPAKRARIENDDSSSSFGSDDDDSVFEVLAITKAPPIALAQVTEKEEEDADQWRCPNCSEMNAASDPRCCDCGAEASAESAAASDDCDIFSALAFFPSFDDTGVTDADWAQLAGDTNNSKPAVAQVTVTTTTTTTTLTNALVSPRIRIPGPKRAAASALASNLERLASLFDVDQQAIVRPRGVDSGSFWEGERYAKALRLFGSILVAPESCRYLERVDDRTLIESGNPPYNQVIKHPLCFRDIAGALVDSDDAANVDTDDGLPQGNDGRLPTLSCLTNWNMWKGVDLLQAIDLVLLNSLAYSRATAEGKSTQRSQTNRIRKTLWAGIKDIIDNNAAMEGTKRKDYVPTRRGESSGFVVHAQPRG